MSTFGDGFLAYHFDIYVEDSAFEYVKEIVKNRQVEFRKAMVSWKSEERLGHTLIIDTSTNLTPIGLRSSMALDTRI